MIWLIFSWMKSIVRGIYAFHSHFVHFPFFIFQFFSLQFSFHSNCVFPTNPNIVNGFRYRFAAGKTTAKTEREAENANVLHTYRCTISFSCAVLIVYNKRSILFHPSKDLYAINGMAFRFSLRMTFLFGWRTLFSLMPFSHFLLSNAKKNEKHSLTDFELVVRQRIPHAFSFR